MREEWEMKSMKMYFFSCSKSNKKIKKKITKKKHKAFVIVFVAIIIDTPIVTYREIFKKWIQI